jgi:mRNA interferase MazF
MQDEAVVRRGDLVVWVLAGNYGKTRPAVVVQSDFFNDSHASIVVCPITSNLTGLGLFRLPLPPSATTGLQCDAEIMVDKLTAVEKSKVGTRIGRLSRIQISQLNRALSVWLELPKA